MLTMTQVDLTHKRVVIRVDFNVPMINGKITNTKRITAALPTIRKALQAGAQSVILLSHSGRPKEGSVDPLLSLAPVIEPLSNLLGMPVVFKQDWVDGIDSTPGQVVLCENVRFQVGENANDPKLSQKIARLGDVFVMDAFACAHRAQASTVGAIHYAQTACAGLLLEQEINMLNQAMHNPKPPIVAIVGGAKISTKLTILESMLDSINYLIVGGGIANTLLAALNQPIGASLYEADLLPAAKQLLAQAAARDVQVIVPKDVLVAKEFKPQAIAQAKMISDVATDDLILDTGELTNHRISEIIAKAATIIWNGPLGVFEFPAFATGTSALARAIADSPGFSLAGGGDTLAAIDQFGVADDISYISTGGGAFLEYWEGRSLPALIALQEKMKYR